MLEYEDFRLLIRDSINKHLPPDEYEDATIQTVIKNNDRTLYGINVRKRGNNIAPTIYLEDYFKRYLDGASVHETLDDIASFIIQNADICPVDKGEINNLDNFESVRDKIRIRLINESLNEEYLKDKPSTPVAGDLRAIYCINLHSNDGNSYVVITNMLLAKYNVSTEELHQIAVNNITPEEVLFTNIFEIISEFLPHKEDSSLDESNIPMYVLTNTAKCYGASCVMSPSVMDMVMDKIGESDIYILPSSIHELIIIKSSGMDTEALRSMVKEVNASEVDPSELLSDEVYQYDYTTHSLMIAA